MSKKFDHTVRVYRGDTVIAVIKVRDDLWPLFNELFVYRQAEMVPCINMVDETHFHDDGSTDERYEFQRIMHFEIKEPAPPQPERKQR